MRVRSWALVCGVSRLAASVADVGLSADFSFPDGPERRTHPDRRAYAVRMGDAGMPRESVGARTGYHLWRGRGRVYGDLDQPSLVNRAVGTDRPRRLRNWHRRLRQYFNVTEGHDGPSRSGDGWIKRRDGLDVVLQFPDCDSAVLFRKRKGGLLRRP